MKQHEEINFTRAVLILLVILIHIVHFGELYPEVKSVILAFMMPSFLLITGYLVNIEKSGGEFGVYLLKIFVPYAIMVAGFAALSYFMPVRDRMTELSVEAFAERIFVSSIGPYWFFYVMLVCGAVYYLSFKLLPGDNLFARFAVFGFLLAVASFVLPVLTVQNAIYYFIGAVLRQCRCRYDEVFRATPYAALPFVVLIVLTRHRDWADVAVAASVFCFLSFSSWCCAKTAARARRWVCWLGKNTLPVFLFHPVFTLASKFGLRFFEWDPTGLVLSVLTIALSVWGSIMIARLLDATGLSRIFARRRFIR